MQEEDTQTIPHMVKAHQEGRLSRRHLIQALTVLGVSAAGTCVVADASIVPAHTATTTPVVDPDNVKEQNLQLHQQHIAHQAQGNINSLHHDYAEEAVVEDSMYSAPFVGRAAIMARKGVGMAAIPDLRLQVTNRVAHGAQVAVEWTATGTHTGDLPGFPASGRSFSLRGVTVVVRREGKIVREAIYYDMHEVQRQLGIRTEISL